MMLRFLDIFFVVFHSFLVLFNLFGWTWKRTRIANLVTLLMTGGSWLILGWITGTPGYCPLTDWHFRILEKLGHTNMPSSYIKYLADRLTGLDFEAHLVDSLTLFGFLAALAASLIINITLRLRKKQKPAGNA
ncbi:MAG: DUF2784 domain-containing protein [Bacteroidales bacterium]|nr:DUF2784 domain-containing protein [Bacteroidales bacterium]